MKRRNFLKVLSVIVPAIAVAPKLLVSDDINSHPNRRDLLKKMYKEYRRKMEYAYFFGQPPPSINF